MTAPYFNPLRDTSLDIWKAQTALYPWKGQATVLAKYNDYPIAKKIWPKAKRETGGTQITWEIVLDDTGNFQFVTPYTEIEYNASDVIGTFSAPWALGHGSYIVSKDEVNANAAASKSAGNTLALENLQQIKREECTRGIFNGIEKQAFLAPSGSTAEQAKQPYGALYSIVPITGAQVTAQAAKVTAGTIAASATGDFLGQHASGFSSCYGVDCSTAKYARYRNWVDYWSNSGGDITEDDIDKILRMYRHLNWTGPINKAEFESGAFNSTQTFTVDNLMTKLERKARDNNDNLGADLGKFAGQVVTKGIPYVWSQAFEDAVSAQCTGVSSPMMAWDTSVFEPLIDSKDDFREDEPKVLEARPRVIATDMWVKYNFVNRDRRRCGFIGYVAPA